MTPVASTIVHSTPEIANKLRESFPRSDERTIAEYLAAQQAFDLSPTPTNLDRLVTAAKLVALPIIYLDQL